MNTHQIRLVASVVLLFILSTLAAADYSWQQPHAKVAPSGDLQWSPEPYVFEAGASIRYIDYEAGDDMADGQSKETAWKHHPWDREATGNAADAAGPTTYVFKGGVAYRGQLEADESGQPGQPIRLSWDPSWGEGKPWFLGSMRLPAQWVPATEIAHPERLPEPKRLWALDLKGTGVLDEQKDGGFRLAYRQGGRAVFKSCSCWGL
jgi:hypothetical protein